VEDGTPLGLSGYTNEELELELLKRSIRGVIILTFSNEKGQRKSVIFKGTNDEVVGIMENELMLQKYINMRERMNDKS